MAGPAKSSEKAKSADPKSADPLVGERMRVWWVPTKDKERTGYAGAYWPVRVLAKAGKAKYTVEYDNMEQEDVLQEHLSTIDVPVAFGKEKIPLQPGEFVEESNGSKTDPCAWLAMIVQHLANGKYMVNYPFHDTKPETIKPKLLRRARVLDAEGWKLAKPHQHWKDGDIASPLEMETIPEADLGMYVPLPKEKPAAGQSGVKPSGKTASKGSSIKKRGATGPPSAAVRTSSRIKT
mmetsp:Transcript_9280/g.16376  ORF Transcript_9280/g.16376 Transcript_9280/m.16376 type:complete len:236 (-) Transcript_9280:621-1328(-)